MKISKALKNFRERQGLAQENIAHDPYISKQLVSHIENDRRKMTKELAKESTGFYDDAELGFHIAREIVGDYITPLSKGKAIEWHRMTLEEWKMTLIFMSD